MCICNHGYEFTSTELEMTELFSQLNVNLGLLLEFYGTGI